MIDLAKKFEEFKKQQETLDPVGMNSRVLLVDATNSYIRCFSATPTMNDDGEHIGGVTGFLKSIALYVRKYKPSRVVMVFDGAGGSQRRRSMFKEYKNNRHSMQRLNRTYGFQSVEDEKESMKWQMRALVETLDNLPVNIYAVENVEADDVIAYLAGIITDKGGTSTIFSTDKDFIQLVSDSCQVYNPVKKKLYDVNTVIENYGIHPHNFLIYRIVDGDKSDNIPGVNGVSLKSLLKNFPSLLEENETRVKEIIEMASQLKSSAAKKICEAHDNGLLDRNEKLMNLKEVNISAAAKLNILEMFDRGPNHYNKYHLTNTMIKYKLLDAFKNFDDWLISSWTFLTRYSRNEE